jgi:hypothetical protein
MPLSNKSFAQISSALTPDVIKYIEQDERYVTFMQEVIPDAIQELLGDVEDDLKFELAMSIFDKITLTKSTLF